MSRVDSFFLFGFSLLLADQCLRSIDRTNGGADSQLQGAIIYIGGGGGLPVAELRPRVCRRQRGAGKGGRGGLRAFVFRVSALGELPSSFLPTLFLFFFCFVARSPSPISSLLLSRFLRFGQLRAERVSEEEASEARRGEAAPIRRRETTAAAAAREKLTGSVLGRRPTDNGERSSLNPAAVGGGWRRPLWLWLLRASRRSR